MLIVPFEPHHLTQIRTQAAQLGWAGLVNEAAGMGLKSAGPCFTAIHRGQIQGSAGLLHRWEGRSAAWALLDREAARDMLPLTRAVLAFLNGQRIRRIEMTVVRRFAAAHRWAGMLGFRYEGPADAYAPDGADCDVYVRLLHEDPMGDGIRLRRVG